MGSSIVDNLWVIVSAVLVFLMQPGFMCLESGLTRQKNSINVAIKNLADFVFSVMIFWLAGFGIMFGISFAGIVGTTGFTPEFGSSFHLVSFFLFQAMFCGTATTIFSGAVAERMRFSSYLGIAAFLSAFIYPLFGHWAWNGIETGVPAGWLGAEGFVDFAGSTVVHSVGGWMALAVLLVVGPRKARFTPEGKPVDICGSNLPLSVLGTLLLWIGWIGFNGGSTLAMDVRVPGIIINTMMAAAAGAVFSLAIGYMLNRISKISFLINGSLGGLVAITACCHCVSVSESVIIGAIAGGVCLMCDEVLLSFGIDDAVSAVPVHLGCGIWGTLAVALFGDPDILGTGLGFYPQLMIQVGGIIAAFVVAFLLPFFIIREINRFSPLRVSAEDENIGLNISEHGARTEAADFLRVMELHEKTGDLSLKVPVDPFTDTGVIAARYNQMMDVLHRIGATFQHLFDGSPQAVVSTDVKGCITRANRGFQSLFGYPATAVVGASNIDLIVPESHCLESVTLRQTILSGKSVEKETHRKHQSGKLIPVSMLGFPLIINNAVEGVFYIYQDITERKTMEDQLYRKAFYDSLTGVPNRVLFMERLKHAFQRKQRKATFNFTVLLIDLDRFKWVNDNLGHQAGDLLLRKVARRFLGCLRSADTLARLGGDEFAVLLEDIAAPKEIVTIAWRLRNEAARPFSIQGTEVFISASIGVILNTSRYTKPDHILRDADIAMYRAKITGKSRFKVFSKKLYQMTHDALQLENDLKKAVERNEFTLFYQPIVCARTEALKGFEALIRWEHPTRGMLPPNKFIPMAEDTGLIVPIGQWVIETACRQLKAWRTRLPAACDLTVSVNISAQQFVHHNLEIIVENSLGAVDLPSGSLMLELTENSVIDKPEAMISHLKKLKEIGVKIAIDDFGTGYFSLAYLKHFPLDCLKIDKSFVDEINTSRENQQIAQAIIMLARNLDLEVVAEGIEDQEQLEIIRSLDCNFIQGYYYSKPLAVKDCEDVIQMAPRHMAPGAVRV